MMGPMKEVPLDECPGSNALITLQRAGQSDLYLVGITEFNLQYSLSWYEVRTEKLAEVLDKFKEPKFQDLLTRNRTKYLIPVKASRKLRRTPPDLKLVIDL